jgi:hypothetical protein
MVIGARRFGMIDTLRVDQALFGYSDGHHLLASSLRFGPRELERLLILRDIASNAASAGADGYWTGVPLADSEKYAFMRTWPAPEMSRPGCVWTHVIFLDALAVERVWEISGLTEAFVRPQIPDNFSGYGDKLSINLGLIRSCDESVNACESLISEVYIGSHFQIERDPSEGLGELLFGIWSQQWPALRRTFRFRTLSGASSARSGALQFDFTLDAGERKKFKGRDEGPTEGWIRSAAADLASETQPTDFRRYMRAQGEILPSSLPSFRILASAFELRNSDAVGIFAVGELFKLVYHLYPNLDQAEAFKKQLVRFDEKYQELLSVQVAVTTVQFLLSSGMDYQLGSAELGEESAAFLWKHAAEELLGLIEEAQLSKSEYADIFLKGLAVFTPAANLRKLIVHADVYLALAARNRELLSEKMLSQFSEAEILDIVGRVKRNSSSVGVLCEALSTNRSRRVAEALFRAHPVESLKRATLLLSKGFYSEPVNPLWLEVAGSTAPAMLGEGILRTFETTSELAAFAEILSYLTPRVEAVGPEVWSEALLRATDDVSGPPRNTFQAFLIGLALSVPRPGAEKLLSYGFETLHQMLWESSLNHQASVILESSLPQPRWFWQNWDVCLRLRRGVTRVFVDAHLPADSFLTLVRDQHLLGILLETLEDTREDREFRNTVLAASNRY